MIYFSRNKINKYLNFFKGDTRKLFKTCIYSAPQSVFLLKSDPLQETEKVK